MRHFNYFGPYYFSCFQAVSTGFVILFIFSNLRFMSICTLFVKFQLFYYRAMHLVQRRYCYRKSSVRPSVCDVDVPWSYRLG